MSIGFLDFCCRALAIFAAAIAIIEMFDLRDGLERRFMSLNSKLGELYQRSQKNSGNAALIYGVNLLFLPFTLYASYFAFFDFDPCVRCNWLELSAYWGLQAFVIAFVAAGILVQGTILLTLTLGALSRFPSGIIGGVSAITAFVALWLSFI